MANEHADCRRSPCNLCRLRSDAMHALDHGPGLPMELREAIVDRILEGDHSAKSAKVALMALGCHLIIAAVDVGRIR